MSLRFAAVFFAFFNLALIFFRKAFWAACAFGLFLAVGLAAGQLVKLR